jgi:uncharacterized SAM-binding protein YcdF (DUF218 family)
LFFALSKVLDVVLMPLAWGLALLAAAIPWRPGRPRNAKRDRVLGAAGIAVIVLFSMAPVQNRLMRYLESSARDTTRPGVTYDAVVLLGGMVEDDVTIARGTTAYNDHVERLFATFDLLRSGRARYAIVSGGPSTREGTVVEAVKLRDTLVGWGIAPERILVEPRAVNTRENAVLVAEIVRREGMRSIVIVTSAYHMSRAEGCFRAVGLAVDTLPADYRAYDPDRTTGGLLPRTTHLEASTRALRELFGRVVYRLMGYSKPA